MAIPRRLGGPTGPGLLALSLLLQGCAAWRGLGEPARPELTNEGLQRLLGKGYTAPDVFKEEVILGSIVDVKDRDWALLMRPQHCYKPYLKASGSFRNASRGKADLPRVDEIRSLWFGLTGKTIAERWLPRLSFDADMRRHLFVQVSGLAYERIPILELSMDDKCMRRLDSDYAGRRKGDELEGIKLVGEVLYAGSVLVKIDDAQKAGFTIEAVLAKLAKLDPKLKYRKINKETLKVTHRRAIGAFLADIRYRPSEAGPLKGDKGPVRIDGVSWSESPGAVERSAAARPAREAAADAHPAPYRQ